MRDQDKELATTAQPTGYLNSHAASTRSHRSRHRLAYHPAERDSPLQLVGKEVPEVWKGGPAAQAPPRPRPQREAAAMKAAQRVRGGTDELDVVALPGQPPARHAEIDLLAACAQQSLSQALIEQ